VRAVILGSAAGGGYPQWNCNCRVCSLYWQNDPRVVRHTQSSFAVSVDGAIWAIFNCSPDIREQVARSKFLHPKQSPRHSPIQAIILTNADIDHIGGLISLRESHALTVWTTGEVRAQIKANPIFDALSPAVVTFATFQSGKPFAPLPGLTVEAFEVPGKAPLYREASDGFSVGRFGNTKGLHVTSAGHGLTYVPGCGAIDDELLAELAKTSTLLFDGTLWTDDEMIVSGTGEKTGRRMGHVPVSGQDGSMSLLSRTPARQKIFVHMNNTNPLLIDGSPERREAESHGWVVSHDGMEIAL
jgi:pyrroloquinoline quinone biosynthesis protein B